jgi:RNA polymerase sigma-70 factor, ECF subfamily
MQYAIKIGGLMLAPTDKDSTIEITRLLKLWAAGDDSALERATRLLYSELRVIAGSYFRGERENHTLQPTALINEAYTRLLRLDSLSFESRNQFLALVARIMRQILVDHARHVHAAKRGGGAPKVELNDSITAADEGSADRFLVLNDALERLATLNPRHAQVIELRYFAGLGVVETAEIVGASAPTVSRDQRIAEAWLKRELAT